MELSEEKKIIESINDYIKKKEDKKVNVYVDVPPDFQEQFISKGKIREKLNYFEHSYDYDDNGESYELVMKVLQELLEEK